MSATPLVYTVLTGDAPIVAVVGTRIWPGLLQQNADLPAIVYHNLGGYRAGSLSGDSHVGAPTFQIDCYAETLAAAYALQALVRTAMDTATTFEAQGDEARELIEPDPGRWRVTADYSVWYND